MGEHTPPQPETVDTYLLGERTLLAWHQWLNTDKRTGRDIGHLRVLASRYGNTSRDVAWWAIAAGVALQHANGQLDEYEAGIDNLMAGAVNDSPYVAEMVRDYLWVVPDDLQAKLDWEDAGADG